MTSVAILGAAGRMGEALIRCARALHTTRVVAAVERADHPGLGQDVGEAAGLGRIGVLLCADLVAAAEHAAVLIDFSDHRAVPGHAEVAVRLGKAMVIGTTGLDEGEARAVRAAAESIPVVWTPNMSLGVTLLFELVQQAARALGLDYDAEIVETHHRHKKDAPSGTGLHLAEAVARGRGQQLRDVACHGRDGIVGERPVGQIGIHAVRSGSVVGDHVVSLASETEIIELSHRALSRDAFAAGALRAAQWVAGRPAGLYGMKDVLGL